MFELSMLCRKFYGVDPAIIAAGIAATASTLNTANQANYAGKNKRQSEKLMKWQHDVNLTDWGLQNEYNLPANQMKRLKEAGLNPALIYGSGSGGMSGASMGSTSAPNQRQEAPQFESGGIIKAFIELQMLEKQKDLLTAQTEATRTNAQYSAAGIPLREQEFQQKGALFPGQLTAQELSNRKIAVDTQFTLNQDERATAMNEQSVRKAIEEVLNLRLQRTTMKIEQDHIRQQIENLKTDNSLKKLEQDIKSHALTSGNVLRLTEEYFKNIQGGKYNPNAFQDAIDEVLKKIKK